MLRAPMLPEIWAAYIAALAAAWPSMVMLAVAGAAAVAVLHRVRARPAVVPWLVLGLSLCLGLSLVIARASVFDDAFISFRFVQNFLHGHGLVWNLGERVEGYTNFLWVLITAAASKLTASDPAEAGLWASIAVYPCSVLIVFLIERDLVRQEREAATFFLPVATAWLAVQSSFVTAGSSGLETGFAALLVAAGLLSMLRADTPNAWGRTGALLILAALTRPDHAIFYAVASLVLAYEQLVLLRPAPRERWRDALRHVLAFAAPFALYAAHTAFRLAYYGEWFPNTYYAKSAGGSYFSQGAVYAATFYLASHVWLIVLPALAWAAWPARERAARRFKLFFLGSFVIYNVYVMKMGGDFMFGRFYVTLLPLLALAISTAIHALLTREGRARLAGFVLAGILCGTAGGVSIIRVGEVQWGISDERTLYPVEQWHPLRITHSNFRVAQVLRTWRDAGLNLRIATSGIGMIGYYSRMEVIDLVGLTDAHVAHQEVKRRGRPGHEKHADGAYIERRMPHLVRDEYHPKRHERLVALHFGSAIAHRTWYVYHYERAVMDRIKQLSPRVRFERFDKYLNSYIKRELRKRTAKELRGDDRFFKRFYFNHNDDPALLEKWQNALTKALARKEQPKSPGAP